MNDETSESGAPIRRYDAPAERQWSPPDMSGSSIDAIDRHIETHIGKIDSVFHEILSDLVHIDVHIVKPVPARPYYTFVTSGMSDLPMTAPVEYAEFRFAELMLCLPAQWPVDSQAEEHYWPIRWLKILARFPHEYKTWLGAHHSMPNGDPPEPIAPGSKLCGIVLARPTTVSVDFHQLRVNDEKTIHFYSVLPVHADEMDFKLKHGGEALLERLGRAKVTEILDPQRPSSLKRPWWRPF